MTPRVIEVKITRLTRSKNNSRYGNFVDDKEEGSATPESYNYKNFSVGAANRSYIKHAIADLGDNSNDYSEDMDESVAFSKGLSDKENCEMQRRIMARTTKHTYNTFNSNENEKSIINSKACVVWNKNHVQTNVSIKRSKNKPVKTNREESTYKITPLSYTTSSKQKQKGFQVQHPDKRRTSQAI